MNDSPTLDDFERSIAHTLNVKAGQLVVDDEENFDTDVSPTVMMVRVSSDATRPGWIRQHRRRLLAMADKRAQDLGIPGTESNLTEEMADNLVG